MEKTKTLILENGDILNLNIESNFVIYAITNKRKNKTSIILKILDNDYEIPLFDLNNEINVYRKIKEIFNLLINNYDWTIDLKDFK